MKRLYLILIFLICLSGRAPGQVLYEHISNHNIYSFIDDLASLQLIEANTAIKPYSRKDIGVWLQQAEANKEKLSPNQQSRLKAFLKEFALETGKLKQGKLVISQKDNYSFHLLTPELSWRDSSNSILIRPIYGASYFNTTNESFAQFYGGAEGLFNFGPSWGAYVSLRDHYQPQEEQLASDPDFFTQEQGGNFKNSTDFSELRGGISYNWKWGSFGLIKDHIAWGDHNNGSNILSGRSPSFPMIKLKASPTKWLDFNYFHGWLVSQEIDSLRSYTTSGGYQRDIFQRKYIAANMFTFRPFKRFNFSVGNAIIYSDVPVQPAYLIPFAMFKSIDHTLNHNIENQNSMLFFNISSRQIKHLHLYFSGYIDELSFTRLSDSNRMNFFSLKVGSTLTGWPFKDLQIALEHTRTTPNTYAHYLPSTTFASNEFNLGHYLGGNSQDYFVSMRYNIFRTLQLTASYTYAMHGDDYPYDFNLPIKVDELPFLESKSWTMNQFHIKAEFLFLPNLRLFLNYYSRQIGGFDLNGITALEYLEKFTPNYLHGNTESLNLGFGIGF